MRLPNLLAVLIVVVFVFPACAQAQSPQIYIPQNDGWHVHVGDDPAWASTAFDDSSWTAASLDFGKIPRDLLSGRSRWYRKRIHLPDQPGPVELLVRSLDGSYEVYVDGIRVGPPIQSSLRWQAAVSRTFPLRAANGSASSDVVVAIRSHLYDQVYVSAYPPRVGIGNPAGVSRTKLAVDGQIFGLHIAALGVNGIMVLAGLILLTLYFQQRGRREYLWLGLCVLFSGIGNTCYSAQNYIPVSWNGFLGDPCEYWFFAVYIEFVYTFVGLKPHRAVRPYQWLVVAMPFVASPLGWSGAINTNVYSWLENSIILPGILVPISLLIVWARRGNREAAVLIVPMLLATLGFILIDAEVAFGYLHPTWQGLPTLRLGLLTIDYVDVSQSLFLLAIGLTIFLRFVRVSQEHVRTQAELEAARAVQDVLIPRRSHRFPASRSILSTIRRSR